MNRLCNKVLYLAAVLGLLVANPLPLGAQVVWTNLGLYGGQTYDIAIAPDNPDRMLAGCYYGDGLFMTPDGGSSWGAVEASNDPPGEGTFKNHAVWSVKMAPSDSNVIWVAHNYWVEKSLDGGKTWIHILNGTMQGTCTNCPASDSFRYCYSLAVDPSSSGTVYVGTSGAYSNYYNKKGAIYRTEDEGVHWTKLNGGANFDYEVVRLDIDASDPDYIYIWAVTSNGGTFIEEAKPGDTVGDGSLYRGAIQRATGAETWTKIFSMYGGKFYDVKAKPNDPNSIFTANDWGIFRHYLEAGTWKYEWILNLSAEPPAPDEVFARNVRALAFDPGNPNLLYAAWKNSHSKWTGIDTRSKVARGLPPYKNVDWEIYTVGFQFLTLEVDPSNPEVVYGGELFRGVYKSQNHGQSWSPVNKGINALLVHDSDVDPKDHSHLIAATDGGVYEKRGAGEWVNTSSFEYTQAQSVAFDPTDRTGFTYYAGTQNYLAKTTNGGIAWALSDKLPNDFISKIAVAPGGQKVFIATRKAGGATGTTGIYRTEDGLSTPTLTQLLSSDLFGFNTVRIDPSDSNRILAGGGNYSGNLVLGNLYESTQGGNPGTWQLTGLTNVVVNEVLIDPRDSNVVYAGCGHSAGTDAPIFKSIDGGTTWKPSFKGMPGVLSSRKAVWGTSGSDVYVGGDYGRILRYDGSTWEPMLSNTSKMIYYIWGTSGRDIFAVGADGMISHFDGSKWSTMNSGTTQYLRGIWGESDRDVFVVGNAGTVLHYDGVIWQKIDISALTTVHLRTVWGTSTSNVFAGGYSGKILRYDGTSWSAMATGTTQMILGIWGSSPTDIFAVGGAGTILHYDGIAWTPMVSPTANELQCVWGASRNNVFAVGANGTIIHYDGDRWTVLNSGTTKYIWRVWGDSGKDVFAVGDAMDTENVILRFDGGNWIKIADPAAIWNSVTDLEFHPENKSIIYASTTKQGVYVSPNEGETWLNLGTPAYDVNSISTGSLYAATQAGLHQCTGTGVIAGELRDRISGGVVNRATVFSDLGVKTLSVNGEYMMVNPVGEFSVTAVKDGYANQTMGKVTVYGGDVSWADFSMDAGVADPTVVPSGSAGGDIGGGGCFISTIADGSR